MIENNLDEKRIKSLEKEATIKSKDLSQNGDGIIKYNRLNTKNNTLNKQKEDSLLNKNIKLSINNAKTMKNKDCNSNTLKDNAKNKNPKHSLKRVDKFGNPIVHGGKHKVTFLDRVSKNNIIEVIKVDNYKEYNKMEEPSSGSSNGCCIIG